MQDETSETDAGRLRAVNRVAGRVRKQYLPTVGGGADPRRGVHRDAHVARVGQGGTPGVESDSDPYVQVVRPNLQEDFALNGERGIKGCRRLFEDREQLVGSDVYLPAARLADGATKQTADIGNQPGVPIAQVPYETGRVLDVGEQERYKACRQRSHLAHTSLGLAADADVPQLPRDE